MATRKYAMAGEVKELSGKLDAVLAALAAKHAAAAPATATPATAPTTVTASKAGEASKAGKTGKPSKTGKTGKTGKDKGKTGKTGVTVRDAEPTIAFENWDDMIVQPHDGSLWLYVSSEVDVISASTSLFKALSSFSWYATRNSAGERARKRTCRFYPAFENGRVVNWRCHLGFIDDIKEADLKAALSDVKASLRRYTPATAPATTPATPAATPATVGFRI